MDKDVPSQYKPKIDSLICDIGDAINELRPFLMELVETLEIENDNFKAKIWIKKSQ